MPNGKSPVVTALLRGLEVLRCFDYERKLLSCSEIARLTGLPQPTVWRLCKTLEQEGYLVSEQGGTRFAPGLAVLTLGYAALGRLDLAELARPRLQTIADRYHGASGMTTRDRLSILLLLRCEGTDAYLNVNLRAGSEVPLATSASGWAYLAALDAANRERLLADIRKRQPELWRRAERPFGKAMEGYAKTGYVLNVDTFFKGLSTVAVPLGGPEENRLYVLYCSCLTSVLGTEKLRRALGLELLDIRQKLLPIIPRVATHGKGTGR